MAASGFAGLGYQIVWTQSSAVWLGHESVAVLAVVTAFFGGLAIGACTLGRRIERSAWPLRWYAGCEALIALWSLLLVWAMGPVGERLLQVIGPQPSAGWHWSVAFGGTLLLLLPATMAMGATLPAMDRVLRDVLREWPDEAASIATLYASNTAGAVAGAFAAAFWLVPAIGLARTSVLCAVLNGLCAVAALRWLPKPTSMREAPLRPHPTDTVTVSPRTAPALARLAVTGLLGIGYEVLVVRVLSQVAENTVYTFALLLVVYLIGTALGAAAYARWAPSPLRQSHQPHQPHQSLQPLQLNSDDRLRDRLLALLAIACLVGSASLWHAQTNLTQLRAAWNAGMPGALGAEAGLAVAAFLLPTLAMGALFSHLSRSASAAGIGFGRALGANTLGAAVAPVLFGLALLPALGAKFALLAIPAAYLALSSRLAWRRAMPWGALAAALALALLAPPLVFVDVPEGGHVVSYREGAMAAVSVVEDANGVSRLRIDNRQQEGSSASLLADARQALLPLLLHPAPRRALFLGLGTGVTAASAATDPTLQVDAVELLPEVIAASAYFSATAADVAAPAELPRRSSPCGSAALLDPWRRECRRHFPGVLNTMAADARRFVRATELHYDVIVSDNFHPARSGSGALYTVEHFQAVRSRLADDGLFCQWLPLHQLDRPTLRSIVKAFMAVYPNGAALLATNSLETPVLGLVSHRDARRFDERQVRERLVNATFRWPLADFGLVDEFALFGSFVAGPRALTAFAGDAEINTDDHPVVTYLAPRITYAPDSLPRDRLIGLLHEWQVGPGDVMAPSGDLALERRLAAYRQARDRFIEVGRDVVPSADPNRMLMQVREPLLSVLRISPDFRPAYDPLLRMALALASRDAAAARALLEALRELQPARPEAALALRELDHRL